MLKFRSDVAGLGLLAAATFGASAAVAAPTYAYVTTALDLRAGPGATHPVITTLNAGDRVAILACLSGRSWCEVDWNGRRGWAAGHFLDLSDGGYNRPLLDVRVTSYRHHPPLNLGEPLKGPSLNPTEVLVGLPEQEPSPRACGIGQNPVNGSCL